MTALRSLLRPAILVAGLSLLLVLGAQGSRSSPLLISENAYRLPYAPGISPPIYTTQGNDCTNLARKDCSHKGKVSKAFDFAQGGNTQFPIVAARSGRVFDFREDQPDGCNQANCPNYVVVVHEPDDGTADLYLHLKSSSVSPEIGDWVVRGCQIATADDTGKSTATHLHFQREQEPSGRGWAKAYTQSVSIMSGPTPSGFEDVPGGVPSPLTAYPSDNGPALPCSGFIFAESGVDLSSGPSQLYLVNPSAAGTDALVDTIHTTDGGQPVMTDMAVSPNGALYGASFEALHLIDRETAVATQIGPGFGVSGVNALAFDQDGNLFAATEFGELLQVDATTGVAAPIGSYGSGFVSSGDIDFAPDGTLFAAVNAPDVANDVLVTVNLATGEATRVNASVDLGHDSVFALVFVGEKLYGLTASSPACGSGLLIEIGRGDGASSLVRCLSFSSFGGT